MTDYSRDRLGPADEDRLPWLEPVEEEPEEGGVGGGRLILWLVIALVVLGVIVGGFFWLRGHDRPSSGGGALIKAPDSYYKERPAAQTPGAGEDEIVYSASKGKEVTSTIDTQGSSETPVNADRPTPAAPAPTATMAVPPPLPVKTAPAAAPTATIPTKVVPAAPIVAPKPVVAKAPPKPVPAPKAAEPEVRVPASGGSIVQLGAFSSLASANSAWKVLSGRFAFLSGLTQSVAPVESNGKTLYRLRASGANARDICGRLKTAGESCSIVG